MSVLLVILRWVVTIPLAAMWAVTTAANGYIALREIRGISKSPSAIPLVGSLAGAIAMATLPVGSIQQRLPFLWIALLADVVLPIQGICGLLYSRKRR